MSRFKHQVSNSELAILRSVIGRMSGDLAGEGVQCHYCHGFAFTDPPEHKEGCRVGAALAILDSYLNTPNIEEALLESLEIARGERG